MEWFIDFGLLISGIIRNHTAGYNDYDQGNIQHYYWYSREPRYGLQRLWSGIILLEVATPSIPTLIKP